MRWQPLKGIRQNIRVAKTKEALIFLLAIATENHSYGKTNEAHYAHYGIITDIKVQDNGIKIYYQFLNSIPQQKLNELFFELGLRGNSSFLYVIQLAGSNEWR